MNTVFQRRHFLTPFLALSLAGCFVAPGMQSSPTDSGSTSPALSGVFNSTNDSLIRVSQQCKDNTSFSYTYSSSLTPETTTEIFCSNGMASGFLKVKNGMTAQTFSIKVYAKMRSTLSTKSLSLTWMYNPSGSVPDHLVLINGDGQSATVTTKVAFDPKVQVVDSSGHGVAGVALDFTITSGNGSLGQVLVTSDSNGFASTTYALGTTAGTGSDVLTVTPDVVFLPGSPGSVIFTESAVAGAPDHLVLVTGDGQSYPRSATLPINPQVQVADVYGNAVTTGVSLTFTVTGGGGSVGASPVISDSFGNASTSYTLGPVAGANTLVVAGQVALPGIPASVTFTETGTNTGTIPDHLIYVTGDGQTAAINTTVAVNPQIQVVDAGGLPVPGVNLVFTVLTGGGLVNGAANVTIASDATGYASVTYKVGGAAGVNSNTMQVAGQAALPGAPATYTFTESSTLTGTIPDHIIYVSGDTQTGTVGQPLPIDLKIQVVDSGGLPVPGVNMVFSATSGGGKFGPITGSKIVTTDSTGYANATYTLGTVSGASNNTALVVKQGAALPGAPANYIFTESANPGPAAQLGFKNIAPSQVAKTCYTGQVRSYDAYGNLSNVTALTQVNLSNTGVLGVGKFFSTLANCNAGAPTITSKNIASGSSNSGNITFKYSDVELISMVATDNAGLLGTGTSSIHVGTKVGLAGPASMNTGTCTGPYTLNSVDGLGTATNIPEDYVLSATNLGFGFFFTDAACTSNLSTVTMTAGTNSVGGVYYRSRKAQSITPTLAATSNYFSNGNTLVLTSNAQAAMQLVITGPSYVTTGSCNAYTIFSMDTWDNYIAPGAPVSITISSSLAGQVFSNAACTLGGPVTLTTSSTTFWMKDAVAEAPVLTADGTVGGLGTANFTAKSQGAISGMTAVSSGTGHTCAINNLGAVKCVGANQYGQLGNSSPGTDKNLAAQVIGLTSNATALASGNNHTCALMSGGGVKCWGWDNSSQTGTNLPDVACRDSTLYCQTSPVDVVGLAGVATAIAAGGKESCAIITGGTMQCWGANGYGQLGKGTTSSSESVSTVKDPSGIGNLTGVTSISVADSTACAVAGGAAYCWGNNGSVGPVGDGTTIDRSLPTQVVGLTANVLKVSSGYNTNCALKTNGAAYCWGNGANGRLGNGATSSSTTPVAVTGIGAGSGAIDISVYNDHACVLFAGGNVKCWGNNNYGEVGDGTTVDKTTPVAVTVGVTALGNGPEALISSVIDGGNVFTTGQGNNFTPAQGGLNDALTFLSTVFWN